MEPAGKVELRLAPFQHTEAGMRVEEVVAEVERSAAAAAAATGIDARLILCTVRHFSAEQSLPRTAHAGESAGPASVWETLRRLEPSRIGHGVRSIEDPALVAHLKERGTHLEVCPSSNVLTDVVDSY